jgi:hypothetical protein
MSPFEHATLSLQHLNWLAVLVAALAGYFPGAIWYSKIGFLRPWARELGIDIDNPPGGKNVGAKVAIGLVPAFAGAMVMGLLLHHPVPVHRGMALGLALAGGIISTSFAVQYLYENRSVKFWLINSGYHLLQYLIMGVVFGLMV